jgi:hypothetical protein
MVKIVIPLYEPPIAWRIKLVDTPRHKALKSVWFLAVIRSCASCISRVASGYKQSKILVLLSIDFNLLARSEPSEHET